MPLEYATDIELSVERLIADGIREFQKHEPVKPELHLHYTHWQEGLQDGYSEAVGMEMIKLDFDKKTKLTNWLREKGIKIDYSYVLAFLKCTPSQKWLAVFVWRPAMIFKKGDPIQGYQIDYVHNDKLTTTLW